MPWIILLGASVLEAVWATAVGASEGFTRPVPVIVFAVALAASLSGLAYAAQHLPVSTAYAVWTGTGAALTVGWGMLSGAEAVTLLRVLFILGIIASVVGLKLVKTTPGARARSAGAVRLVPASDARATGDGGDRDGRRQE